jgi:peptidoglycan/LPS O-acetylase OafA/YrhL
MNAVTPVEGRPVRTDDASVVSEPTIILPMSPGRSQKAEAQPVTSVPRMITLDSLRGVAAFTVMIHHFVLTSPVVYPYGQAEAPLWARLIQFSPLHLFWAGYEAVVLFFVLSGFVLALPFTSNQPLNYRSFVLKRWARIWILYIAVVTLAALCALLLWNHRVEGLSNWFDNAWSGRTVEGYLNHVLLIGDLDRFSVQFLPVVWSLRYEMLASLAFPLLLTLRRKVSWPLLLLLGAAMNVVGIQYAGSLSPLRYILMFLVGILLAQHRLALVQLFQKMPRALHVPLLALAFSLYLCSWLAWKEVRPALEVSLLDWGITAASAFAIVTALASQTAHRLLSWPPLVWLGRVSYSVYLTHTLVLLVVVHAASQWVPAWILIILCVPITLWVSQLTHRWIEVPAISLGRRLTNRRQE